MAATFFNSMFQVLDSSGVPIVGAKLRFDVAGTTTPLTTYQDEGLLTANTNPVISLSDGRFPAIFLQSVDYKVTLSDASDVVLATRDNVEPGGAGSVAIGDLPDNLFRVVDNGDATKKLAFEVSSVATATTRTLTVPDASGTITLNDATQTLTNKTLAIGSNTVSGTTAQFNTALTDGDFTTLAGTETLINKTMTNAALNGTLTGTAILDDDTFATASSTTVPTSESTKAFVLANIGGGGGGVANIAAMTAILKAALTTNDTRDVSAFTTAGDGGNGVFRWDSTATDTAVTGIIIASDEGGNGRWFRNLIDNTILLRFGGAVADGSTDDQTIYTALFNYCKTNGIKLRGEGLTYRLATLFTPTFSTGDEVDIDDMEVFSDITSGSDVYAFNLDAGDLETAIPVTSNVARSATSVSVSGGTKPVAGDYYYLLSDEAADFADVKDTQKGCMVRIKPSYNGTDTVVPIVSLVPCSFATASSARLRRIVGQDFTIRIGQDQNNFSLRGAGGVFDVTGLATRFLHNSLINVRKLTGFYKRGHLDRASYNPIHTFDRIEDPMSTGIAYAIVAVGTQGGKLWAKSTGNLGTLFSSGSVTTSSEVIPSRYVDFPLCYYDGCSRTVIDAHPGGFYTRYGGAIGTASTPEDSSEDGITITGSNAVVYGPFLMEGSGHRHGIAYSSFGCKDDPNYTETLRIESFKANYANNALVVSSPSGATLTRPIKVTIGSMVGEGGLSGIEIQPEDGDMTVKIDSLVLRTTAGRGLYVLSQTASSARGYIVVDNGDIETAGAAVAEFDGATFAATGAGIITINSGVAIRNNGGGTVHFDADYGDIVLGPSVVIDGTSDDSAESNNGLVKRILPQELDTTDNVAFNKIALGGNTSGVAVGATTTSLVVGQFLTSNSEAQFQVIRSSGGNDARFFVDTTGIGLSVGATGKFFIALNSTPTSCLQLTSAAAVNAGATGGHFEILGTDVIDPDRGIRNATYTATNIADVAHAVNTQSKATAKQVWDTTNSKVKYATGSGTTATWVDADGTNAVTPA